MENDSQERPAGRFVSRSDDYDPELQARMVEVLSQFIAHESHDPERGGPQLRIGDLCVALTKLLAHYASFAPMATPAEIRRFSDEFAKRLRVEIPQARARMAASLPVVPRPERRN